MVSRLLVASVLVTAACHSSDSSRAGAGSSVPPTGSSAPPAAGSAATGSGATGSAAPAATTDPCTYATKEEVGAAIGLPIVETQQASPEQCGYFPKPRPSNGLYVSVSDGGVYTAMTQTLRDMTQVPGLGDAAMWGGSVLYVHAGAKMITIRVMDTSWKAGDSKGIAVAVANAVLPRLR